jgi:hypothetical protein
MRKIEKHTETKKYVWSRKKRNGMKEEEIIEGKER